MESRKSFNELLMRVTNYMSDSVVFVNTYMKDQDGRAYEKATSTNYLRILDGEIRWKQLSFQQRNIIHGLVLTQNSKDYEQLLKEAYVWRDVSLRFLKEYVYDERTDQYQLTSENYLRVLEGVYCWNQLNVEERKAIHAMLAYDQVESYPMLYERAMHVKKEVDGFIGAYLMKDGETFMNVNNANYKKILKGESIWKQKTSFLQKAINHTLKQPTYEQLLNGAIMLQESTNAFLKTYLTNCDGKLYELVTESNYRQILKGQGKWDCMTLNQREIINHALIMQESKIYEDMLDDAKVFSLEQQGVYPHVSHR